MKQRVAMSVLTAVLAAVPALAHHSFATFDVAKVSTISGTVKEFEWGNPHVWINLEVCSSSVASCGPLVWPIEGGSPNALAHSGWNRKSLKVGDKVSMDIHPLRTGKPGGALISVRLPDGRVLSNLPPKAEEPGNPSATSP